MKKYLLSYLLCIFISISSFAQNTWQTKAPFIPGKRAGANAFGISDFGYVFGGCDTAGQAHNDLWMYDPAADQWSQRASLPGPARYSGVSCVIGNKAYMGTGFDGSSYYNDWWEYNAGTNSWIQLNSFPGDVRSTGISCSINNKAYMGMGKGATWYDDWYEYDPASNVWTQKSAFPAGSRQTGVAFGIGSYGYIGLGSVNNAYAVNDMYKYDPANDSWTAVASYPVASGVYSPGCFVISNKAFVCGGYDYTNLHTDGYEYDPVADSWAPIADFSNVSPARYFREGFSVRGKGYLVGGSIDASLGTTGYRNDLIEYSSKYTGIEEIRKNDFTLSYDVSSAELVFSSTRITGDYSVSVYSSSGSLVCRLDIHRNARKSIPLSISQGVYLYAVESKSGQKFCGKFSVVY